MRITGWIFDAYPVSAGISLWILDTCGRMHSALDSWKPRLYVRDCKPLRTFLQRNRLPVDIQIIERIDFYTYGPIRVVEIRVHNPLQYETFVRQLEKISGLELYNCDIHLVQAYHYERKHFPLAKGEFTINDGQLREWHLQDSPWALDYEWPPFRFLYLSLDKTIDPNHTQKGNLLLTLGDKPSVGTSYLLDESDPRELLAALHGHITQWDPDVILSDWGDSYIFPRLMLLSRQTGIPIRLCRDPERGVAGRASRSFFTYGRTIYQGGAQYLFGRLHLDMKNSFTLRETGLDGLFEIARIAKIPIQRAARCTIGTSLSSMQLDIAEQEGILTPLHKQQTEDMRDGMSLIIADKGGIVYEPEIGWHEQVAEADFVSMYPSIMVHYNVSPETVNCACCPDNPVPEVSHHICTKRPGLIPKVLERILEKRAAYKRMYKAIDDGERKAVYKNRYTAHKWALVTCFGYLGFKNARFGKIEAHECVSAYGREVLLKAKDIAESQGYHFVHGIVDSLWIKKMGATEKDYKDLVRLISQETGFDMGLEGIYQWISFCPSKEDAKIGVPNRYFGCFSTKELKIRGIEIRRHDTPPLFKQFQEEMLTCLSQADTLTECRARIPQLEDIYESFQDRLRTGSVSMHELAFTSVLSKEPTAYIHDTFSSIAARQLAASGITLHAGEAIQYVICSARDKVKDWRVMPLALAVNYAEYDPKKYLELLERAYWTIMEGLIEKPVRGKGSRKRTPENLVFRFYDEMIVTG